MNLGPVGNNVFSLIITLVLVLVLVPVPVIVLVLLLLLLMIIVILMIMSLGPVGKPRLLAHVGPRDVDAALILRGLGCGKAELWFFVGFLCTLFQNFAGISPEFDQNFAGNSPEYRTGAP